VFAATEDLGVAAGPSTEGRIGHVNWRWNGIVAGQPKLTMSIHWWMEEAHLDELDPPLWRIRIKGHPGVRISVDLEKREGDTTATSAEQIGVAGAVLNAIPHVVAATPGLMTRPLATPFRTRLADA
jgi:2,4-diaminopentanoate dehydrogenase